MPKLYTMTEAARMCGKKPDTLYRWAAIGLRGTRLQVTYVGGSPRVTQAALDEFFRRVTAARRPNPAENHES